MFRVLCKTLDRSPVPECVDRGSTAARKHARDAVDDARLISDKHRDDVLLDALIQRLGPIDIDVIDFFRAPKLHKALLRILVHAEHKLASFKMLLRSSFTGHLQVTADSTFKEFCHQAGKAHPLRHCIQPSGSLQVRNMHQSWRAGECAQEWSGHTEVARHMHNEENSVPLSTEQGRRNTCRRCQLVCLPCCRLECQAGLGRVQRPAELRTGSRDSAGEASGSAACPPVAPDSVSTSRHLSSKAKT